MDTVRVRWFAREGLKGGFPSVSPCRLFPCVHSGVFDKKVYRLSAGSFICSTVVKVNFDYGRDPKKDS